ncbi:MAG TPA: hypothetical protein VNS53_08965 [Sphingomicrobium sp.]|jgi:hypothetical protein|nr:hypothetical protein [Sphingomicrobium sp.]
MRAIRLFLLLVVFGWSAAASAAVEIAFYSKDMASSFPHAYVRLTGTDEATGKPVDVNYGFTPASLSPGVLFGSVRGIIESASPAYIARSDRHFALKLTDAQYRQVVAIVEKWRAAPQPSYRLNGRNCIDFVAEIANALGLKAPVIPKLMKKPRSYLDEVARLNAALIAGWDAHLAAQSVAPVAALPAVAH